MQLGSKAIRGLAAGIGLASEAYKAKKREKEIPAPGPTEQTKHMDRLPDTQLEEDWELDEAQDELCAENREQNQAQQHQHSACNTEAETEAEALSNDHTVQAFLRNTQCTPPPYISDPSTAPKLLYPVILPQRRPRSNKRGFIRAYPPDLEQFAIDQEIFLNFIETSNKVCQATPWLYALNLASIGTIWLPSALSFIVSTMIQLGTEAAIMADERRKTNSFFDKVNAEFFRPRGLFCLVMTWEPGSSSTFCKFDLNTAISTAVEHGGPGMLNKLKHTFKASNGATHGELPFPQTAPLIFPQLDALAASGSNPQVKKLKKKDFVADYFDRRSQAKFRYENPNSGLNISPKPTFASRYADPSHPASSGDLLGFVSGGHITSDKLPRRQSPLAPVHDGRFANLPGGNIGLRHVPGGEIIRAIASRRGGVQSQYEYRHDELGGKAEQAGTTFYVKPSVGDRGRGARGSEARRDGPLADGLVGGVKKLLQSNVLYLMIVNMPSEEEMIAAREMLNR
ncbi:hypothetical protein BJX63DRAFT_57809 [Aspergillus granulosus]|uniref:Uncharacterized protein n=1 Tax=Aspergillus granulosus TaxID=176169 RepID=A0ABR4HT86_9EURO